VRAPSDAELAARPVERVSALVELLGADAVADWCVDLLRGGDWTDDDAPELPDLDWIGGRSSVAMVAKDLDLGYWPRVWAARALLHAYRPRAEPAVVGGLSDASWRVREMCAKVVRAHELGSAADELAPRCADEVPRVRAAAVRALAVVGEAEHADAVRDCLDDPEPSVRTAAAAALRALARRLDRPL
jgi:HEAT repeat protein